MSIILQRLSNLRVKLFKNEFSGIAFLIEKHAPFGKIKIYTEQPQYKILIK